MEHRFVARRFHRDIDEERAETPSYEISVERQAVRPLNAGPNSLLSAQTIQTMAVCDTDLIHSSHISDEEVALVAFPTWCCYLWD